MRAFVVSGVLAALLVGGSTAATSDEGEPRLRFNPFLEVDGAPHARGPTRGALREEPWEPTLRAALFAGDSSVANLGGVVLAIGEETHGYKLVEVREFGAVFERGGERIELEVAPPASHERSGAGR